MKKECLFLVLYWLLSLLIPSPNLQSDLPRCYPFRNLSDGCPKNMKGSVVTKVPIRAFFFEASDRTHRGGCVDCIAFSAGYSNVFLNRSGHVNKDMGTIQPATTCCSYQ